MAEKKQLEEGMYNCTVKATKEDKVYHFSTAQTLLDKGIITVGKKIKKYVPKGVFEKEVSENE
jgi:hypothetical protein